MFNVRCILIFHLHLVSRFIKNNYEKYRQCYLIYRSFILNRAILISLNPVIRIQ